MSEHEEAIYWYSSQSNSASQGFIETIEEKLGRITENPKQYKKFHKKYYEVAVNKYPYSVIYLVDEYLQQIVVVAIYHHKRHPKK